MSSNDWKEFKLSDICQIKYGRDHKNLDNGNIPVYGSGGIMRYVDSFIYDKPSVLIPRKGTLSNLFLVSEKFWTVDTLFWTIIDETIVSPEFLYYQLLTKNLVDMNVGSAVPSLTTTLLNELRLKIPSLETQSSISGILSSLDEKIKLNKKINKTLEDIAQAIFKSWFVDFEKNKNDQFMSFADWEIPESYQYGRADRFFDISIGKTPPRNESKWFSISNNDIKWLSIADMGKGGVYSKKTSEYLTNEAISKFNIKLVPSNTVMLSFKLTIGRVVISNDEMTTNEAIAHFKSKNQDIVEYIYLFLKNYEFSKLGSTSSIGTAINSKVVKSMPIYIPDEDTLQCFHNVVLPIFNKIMINQQENDNLTEIRDTLLPKLMSGEINVLHEEVSNAEVR